MDNFLPFKIFSVHDDSNFVIYDNSCKRNDMKSCPKPPPAKYISPASPPKESPIESKLDTLSLNIDELNTVLQHLANRISLICVPTEEPQMYVSDAIPAENQPSKLVQILEELNGKVVDMRYFIESLSRSVEL